MADIMPFGEVLEAVELLSLQEKEALLEVLNKRVVEERRAQLAREIQEANREFEDGQAKPATVDDLMKDIAL